MVEEPFTEVTGVADHGEADEVENRSSDGGHSRCIDVTCAGSVLVLDVECNAFL